MDKTANINKVDIDILAERVKGISRLMAMVAEKDGLLNVELVESLALKAFLYGVAVNSQSVKELKDNAMYLFPFV